MLISIAAFVFSIPQDKPSRYYLLVGVGAYQTITTPGVKSARSLYGPDRDVEVLAARLNRLGWKALPATTGKLTSVRDKDELVMRADLPTRDNILAALQAAKNLKPDDEFMFYYSGHGVTISGDDALLPYDVKLKFSGGKWKLERASTISFKKDLTPIFSELKSANRAVILNMCREQVDEAEKTLQVGSYSDMLMSVFDAPGVALPFLLWTTQPGRFAYAGSKPDDLTLFGKEFSDALVDKANVIGGNVSLVRAAQTTRYNVHATSSADPRAYSKGPMLPEYMTRFPEDLFPLGSATVGNESERHASEDSNARSYPNDVDWNSLELGAVRVDGSEESAVKRIQSFSDTLDFRFVVAKERKFRIRYLELKDGVFRIAKWPSNLVAYVASGDSVNGGDVDRFVASSQRISEASSGLSPFTGEVFRVLLVQDNNLVPTDDGTLVVGNEEGRTALVPAHVQFMNEAKEPDAVRLAFCVTVNGKRAWRYALLTAE